MCCLPCSAVAEGTGPNSVATVDAAAGDSERVMTRHSSISGRPSASATVIPSASALGPQPVLRSTLKHKVPNRSVTHEALGSKKTRDNKATLLQDLLLQVRVSAMKCCLQGALLILCIATTTRASLTRGCTHLSWMVLQHEHLHSLRSHDV